jgi:DNA-binding NarL/FixJ family response regulator
MAKRVFEKEITERDIKILQGLAEGKDDKEIAEVIGFSHQTVNAAFPKIMFKLGAVNRYNALYIALKRKLIK